MINSGQNERNKEKTAGWARKLFAGLMIIFSVALAVTAIASAFTLPPVVTLTANPNPAQLTSTIVAVASDLSHTGIAWIKIYENGVELSDCSSSSSSLLICTVHHSSGSWAYNASAADRTGKVSNTAIVSVVFTSPLPILNPIGNFTVDVGQNLQFAISGYSFLPAHALTYSAFGVPAGATFNPATRTFSWTPVADDLGLHQVNFSINDSSGFDSELVTINVTDRIPPQYFNLSQFSGSLTYSPIRVYELNATWIDNVKVDRVWIVFDGVRYNNVISNANNIYTFDITGLGTGQHNFTWFANDTSGNQNDTGNAFGVGGNLTIERANTTTSVVVSPSSPITYGNLSNFSCSNSGNLATVLFVNGVNANSEAGLSIVRSAGNYTLSCSSIENENYTASSSGDVNYVIQKAVPVLRSSVTSPINYTTASNYVANESNSGDDDLVYVLFRNGVPINAGSNVFDNSVLGAGTYVYAYNTIGGQNYTSAEVVNTLVVEKADPRFVGSPVLNITFLPSNNVVLGTATTVAGIGCPSQLTCNLFRDGASVVNPDDATLGAGTYNYEFNTTGNENYTSASAFGTLTVNKIGPDLHLFIDSVEQDKNVTYNATTNVSASSSTSNVELYRNGNLVSNPENRILAAGTYNYTAYALENENYSSASITRFIVVNRSTSQCFIESNSSQTYPNPVNVSAICTNPEASLQLFRNETDVTGENAQNVLVNAGTWTYKVNVSESENYTAAENSTTVVVNKGTPVMNYSLNGGIANLTIVYNQTVNVSVSSDAGTVQIFRNGADVTSENGNDVVLGVGTWAYSFNVTGDSNWNDVPSEFLIVTVIPGNASLSLVFDKVSPQNYSNGITATCSVLVGAGSPVLYRNGVNVTSENGNEVFLAAGPYDYNCTLPATENYTYTENASTFVIAPIVMPLHLYIDGVEANKTIVYNASVNVNAVKDYAEGSIVLYRNGVNVTSENGNSLILGAGLYNYTAYFVATQNFTESSKTLFLNVTKADPTNNTNPSGVWLNLSILPSDNVTYGNVTNVTGSGCPAELLCGLRRNDGVPINNSDIGVLGAGNYSYVYSTIGNENYTAGSVSGNLTVNRAVPSMDYFINGGKANITSEELIQINATAYANAGTVNIFRNGTNVSAENGLNVTLGLGTYVYAFNVTGNENYTDVPSEFLTVNIVDRTAPLIWFENGTAINGNQTGNSIFVNASASDLHISNITLNIYNATGLYNSSVCVTSGVTGNCFANFTGLADGTYWFNATAVDSSLNNVSTETRMITIDSTVPEVVGLNITPNSTLMGQTNKISVNVTDLHLDKVIAEITQPNGSVENFSLVGAGNVFSFVYGNTAQNGTYNVRIIANDTFGNVNDSENANFTVNYGVRTIINSNVYGEYYPNNYTSEVKTTNITDSAMITTRIINSTISGLIANITDSLINNSRLTDVTVINVCEVHNSVVVGGTCDHVYIDPSDVRNSNTTGSRVINSRIWNSSVTYSGINASNIDFANIDNSNATNSTLKNVSINESSIVENSNVQNVTAVNSVLTNTTLGDERAIVVNGAAIIGEMVYNGTFSYNGSAVNITAPTHFRYLINYAPLARLKTVPSLGPDMTIYVGESMFFDASESTDLNINETTGESLALTFNESLAYNFDFGDGFGSNGNVSNASHMYSAAGNYLTSVIVTDAFGESSVAGDVLIRVIARPSSGGGGGGSARCFTNWTCTEWTTECVDGVLTRVCAKAEARCNILEPKPAESIKCTKETRTNQTSGGFIGEVGSTITGAVTGAWNSPGMRWALIFILAVLIAGGILWFARKNKSKTSRGKSRRK